MSTLHNSPEALKHLRQILDSMQELGALYAEPTEPQEEEHGDHETEQEVVDRIVEEAGEMGMDEDGIEKVVKLVLAYCKKSAE